MNEPLKMLLVGGDARKTVQFPDGVEVQRLGSQRDAGNGAIRRALTSIRNHAVDLVVLLVRWLGHPATHAIVAACKRAGVPLIRVHGGRSSAVRAVTLHLTEVAHG